MVNIKAVNKYMQDTGKRLKNFQCFDHVPGAKFSALKNARTVLTDNGYTWGASHCNEPIAIKHQQRGMVGLLVSTSFKSDEVFLFIFKDAKKPIDLDALKYEIAKKGGTC